MFTTENCARVGNAFCNAFAALFPKGKIPANMIQKIGKLFLAMEWTDSQYVKNAADAASAFKRFASPFVLTRHVVLGLRETHKFYETFSSKKWREVLIGESFDDVCLPGDAYNENVSFVSLVLRASKAFQKACDAISLQSVLSKNGVAEHDARLGKRVSLAGAYKGLAQAVEYPINLVVDAGKFYGNYKGTRKEHYWGNLIGTVCNLFATGASGCVVYRFFAVPSKATNAQLNKVILGCASVAAVGLFLKAWANDYEKLSTEANAAKRAYVPSVETAV